MKFYIENSVINLLTVFTLKFKVKSEHKIRIKKGIEKKKNIILDQSLNDSG